MKASFTSSCNNMHHPIYSDQAPTCKPAMPVQAMLNSPLNLWLGCYIIIGCSHPILSHWEEQEDLLLLWEVQIETWEPNGPLQYFHKRTLPHADARSIETCMRATSDPSVCICNSVCLRGAGMHAIHRPVCVRCTISFSRSSSFVASLSRTLASSLVHRQAIYNWRPNHGCENGPWKFRVSGHEFNAFVLGRKKWRVWCDAWVNDMHMQIQTGFSGRVRRVQRHVFWRAWVGRLLLLCAPFVSTWRIAPKLLNHVGSRH
jgi:hypothetical protein